MPFPIPGSLFTENKNSVHLIFLSNSVACLIIKPREELQKSRSIVCLTTTFLSKCFPYSAGLPDPY